VSHKLEVGELAMFKRLKKAEKAEKLVTSLA